MSYHRTNITVAAVTWIVCLAVGLMLAGCARPTSSAPSLTREAIEIARPRLPAQMLTCTAEPRSPGGRATDAQAARYVLDVVDAGRDCRRKLGAVKEALR
jgi:hypothetical protein